MHLEADADLPLHKTLLVRDIIAKYVAQAGSLHRAQCNASARKLKRTPPHRKNNATSKFSFEEISVATLARTDTTLHHNQYWLAHWARIF